MNEFNTHIFIVGKWKYRARGVTWKGAMRSLLITMRENDHDLKPGDTIKYVGVGDDQ